MLCRSESHASATSAPVAIDTDAGADYSPPSTPDYREGSDVELADAFDTLHTEHTEGVAPAASAPAPALGPGLLEPPFSGGADVEDLNGLRLVFPSQIVRELFRQHAGRLPEAHELRPLVEYFSPYYRSACLHTEIIIRSYLINEGEIEPDTSEVELHSEADSDATRVSESSESICSAAEEAPAQEPPCQV